MTTLLPLFALVYPLVVVASFFLVLKFRLVHVVLVPTLLIEAAFY